MQNFLLGYHSTGGAGRAMQDSRKIAFAVLVLMAAQTMPSPLHAADQHSHAGSVASDDGAPRRTAIGIAGNPAAIEDSSGTGWLGRQLGLKDGWTLGGFWVGSGNALLSGGIEPGLTFNSQFILGIQANLEKTHGLKGSSIGAQFMQLNNDPTNANAGTVLGFNTIDSTPPTNRAELVQLWWRQALFDDRIVVQIGKVNPGGDFGNVVRPILTTAPARDIGVVTSLLYGSVYAPATFFGVFPGFYETPFGITTTWAPNDNFYVAYGAYDGNLARGVPVGIRWPEFNGYYIQVAETGLNWLLGPEAKPGNIAVGGYVQSGELSTGTGITEDGVTGFYVYGSQQIWYRDPEPVSNAGISAFFQIAWNYTKTLPFEFYVGSGLTFRGLVEARPKDSFGVGLAWGELNRNLFVNSSELLLQGYYQAHVTGTLYTETALSYIPEPGAEPGIAPTWAVTQQMVLAF